MKSFSLQFTYYLVTRETNTSLFLNLLCKYLAFNYQLIITEDPMWSEILGSLSPIGSVVFHA